MRAGDLNVRLQFESRATASDGHGNEDGDYVAQFTRWASVLPSRGTDMRGTETVQAARLTGSLPVMVRVRRDAQTATVSADWQVRDLNSGTVYAVVGPPGDPTGRREFLEIPAASGVAS